MSQRVLIDASTCLTPWDGVGRTVTALLEAMLRQQPPLELLPFVRKLLGPGVTHVNATPLPRTARLRLPRAACPIIARLGLIERCWPAALYHATDHYLPLRDPSRALVTIHDVMFMLKPEIPDQVRMARMVPPFVRRCRHVVTCSENSKRDVVAQLGVAPERISVIPWGVDGSFYAPATDPAGLRRELAARWGVRPPYFLIVSCTPARKNTRRAVRVFAELAATRNDCSLVVVWTPPPEWRAPYAALEAAGRLRFTGFLSTPDLRDLYRGAQATLYPSLYEGFGLPVLESLSCGTPVITSNRSSLPEVGGDAALYVDPEDDGAIRNALAWCLDEPADLERRRHLGLAQAARFTWAECARRTLALYAQLLA